MDFRLKALVAVVAGVFLELLSYQVVLSPWMDMGWNEPIAKALHGMGLTRVAQYFGLIWTRVPEWAMAFIGGIVIATTNEKDHVAVAVAGGLGIMLGGYLAPAIEGYSQTYGVWGTKFVLAYWVLGGGSLVLAYIGSLLGGLFSRRGG